MRSYRTGLFITCTLLSCGVDASLRGRPAFKRRLPGKDDKTPEPAKYGLEVYVEEYMIEDAHQQEEEGERRVEEEEDNAVLDAAPNNDSVICIEKSIVEHMSNIAKTYLTNEKGLDLENEWGQVQKVIYKPNGGEEITVTGQKDQDSHSVFITKEWVEKLEEEPSGDDENDSASGKLDTVTVKETGIKTSDTEPKGGVTPAGNDKEVTKSSDKKGRGKGDVTASPIDNSEEKAKTQGPTRKPKAADKGSKGSAATKESESDKKSAKKTRDKSERALANTLTNAEPKKRSRRKKRKRKKRWSGVFKIKVHCQFCNPDNSDQQRKVRKLQKTKQRQRDRNLGGPNFLMWMKTNLAQQISEDCPAVNATGTNFWLIK